MSGQISISDVEKAEKTVAKLGNLIESIEKYVKTLKSQTAGMSSFWKDNKYKEVKKYFDETASSLAVAKKRAKDLKDNMDGQIKEAKAILNTKINH